MREILKNSERDHQLEESILRCYFSPKWSVDSTQSQWNSHLAFLLLFFFWQINFQNHWSKDLQYPIELRQDRVRGLTLMRYNYTSIWMDRLKRLTILKDLEEMDITCLLIQSFIPREMKAYVHKKIFIWMFTTALFVIATSWKYSSAGKWMNKFYIQYSAFQINELLIYFTNGIIK